MTDTSVDASAFNTLDATTSVVLNSSNITSLTGAAADLNTAYDSSGISNLGDEAVTLTDTSLTASVLNTLDGNTSGTVNANTVSTLSGAAADLNTAYDSSGISNLGDEAVTLTDTSLSASVLNTLDGNTSGTVNANTVSTLSGAAADLNTAYDSSGISNLGDEAVTLTDTSLSASVLNTLDGNTSGTVNANTVSTLSGAAADLNTAYDSSGISNLGDEAITLTDTSLSASVLNTLDGNTSGTVNANTVSTLSGAAADLNTAYDSSGISNLGDEAITLTDTSLSASVLNTLDGNTSGTVNANTVSTLSGAAADLNTAYDSAGISNLGDEAVTLTDTSLSASVLNTLDGNTSGTVNANTVSTLSGAAADLNTAYDSSGISNLGDEAVTLTDTSLAASVLNILDGNTSGTVNASSVNELTGDADEINSSYASEGITNLAEAAATATPSIAINANTSSLKAGQTATITFTLSEIATDFTESDITLEGGLLSDFSGSGTTYTATFTPTSNSTNDGVVSVASGSFTNSLGNLNRDGSDSDNTLTLSINTVPASSGGGSGSSSSFTANPRTTIDSETELSDGPSIAGRAIFRLYDNTLLEKAAKQGGALFSRIALRFQGIKNKAENGIGNSIKALHALIDSNNDGEIQERKHTVLNTSDQASFRLVPEVIVEGDVPKADIAKYQDQINQRFSNTIHRVDYQFDDVYPNWNALIKPDISGQLRFFGYDPVTGIGGVMRDHDGDGKPDGATLFLKDNEYGDLNPDPFIIEDPIGTAELEDHPKLVATADRLGLTVEGPEGLGLWVRLKTDCAEGDWQNSLQLISNQRNKIGAIGATCNSNNLGQQEIYLQVGEELRFQQSSNNRALQASPLIKLEQNIMDESWSLRLEDGGELNNQNEDYDDLNISISGHLTPESLENYMIARSQTHQHAGVFDLQALHQETVTLKIEANSHCADRNRLAFVRFDDNNDVLSVNGIQADGSEAFQDMVRESIIEPNQQQIELSGTSSNTLEWSIQSTDYGLYAPVLITSDGTIHTASNLSADASAGHLKLLGMNHFGFEDTLDRDDSDWDYNDLTVRVSVL